MNVLLQRRTAVNGHGQEVSGPVHSRTLPRGRGEYRGRAVVSDPTIILVLNGLHLAIEMLEHDVHPTTGEVLESSANHLSDVAAFGVGSAVGLRASPVQCGGLLLAAVVVLGVNEVGREVFPKRWPVNPAFGGGR